MTTHTVSNWSQLVGLSLSSGDTIDIDSDFTVSSTDSEKDISDVTVNGNSHTITFGAGRNRGIFICNGATVNDLIIDGGGNTLASNQALFTHYINSISEHWGDFNRCRATNVTLGTNGGSILCRYNDSSNTSTLTQCEVDNIGFGGTGAGGFVGDNNANVTLVNCKASVTTAITVSSCGCLVGTNCNLIQITGCHVNYTGDLGNNCALFLANTDGADIDITIERSFGLITGGDLTGTYGGAFIKGLGSAGGGTVNISDCYVSADVANTFTGAFVGYIHNGYTVNITSCYHVGTLEGANSFSVAGFLNTSGTINVTDCVVQSTSYVRTGWGTPTILRTDIGNTSMTNRVPDGTDVAQTSVNGHAVFTTPDTWGVGADTLYPVLDQFLNQPWTNYSSYNDEPDLNPNWICLHPDTIVITERGHIPIKDVRKGNMVCTADNRLITVINNIISYPPTDTFIKVLKGAIADGVPNTDVLITEGHPIVIEGKEVLPETLICQGKCEKVRLDNKVLTYSICTEERIPVLMNNLEVITWAQNELGHFLSSNSVMIKKI